MQHNAWKQLSALLCLAPGETHSWRALTWSSSPFCDLTYPPQSTSCPSTNSHFHIRGHIFTWDGHSHGQSNGFHESGNTSLWDIMSHQNAHIIIYYVHMSIFIGTINDVTFCSISIYLQIPRQHCSLIIHEHSWIERWQCYPQITLQQRPCTLPKRWIFKKRNYQGMATSSCMWLYIQEPIQVLRKILLPKYIWNPIWTFCPKYQCLHNWEVDEKIKTFVLMISWLT